MHFGFAKLESCFQCLIFDTFPGRSERRRDIRTARPGFFSPSSRRLRRLSRRSRWRSGALSLRVASSVGAPTDIGSPLGAVVPDADQIVRDADVTAARRVLVVRTVRGVDGMSEIVAALLQLIDEQEHRGDRVGATRIGECLTDLMVTYLQGVREGVGKVLEDAQRPAAPALVLLIRRAVSAETNAMSPVMINVLGRLLELTARGESVAGIIAARVSLAHRDRDWLSSAAPLLVDAFARSLETSDAVAELSLRRVFGHAFDGTIDSPALVRAASEACALAPWLNYWRAAPIWGWYSDCLSVAPQSEKLIGLLSTGTSALLAGCMSVAYAVASWSRPMRPLSPTIVPAIIEEASVRSIANGGYLGNQPAPALVAFADFADSL